jgi:hypothetical protein
MSNFFNTIRDYNFWVTQPPANMLKEDLLLAYAFAGFLLVGFLFWVWQRFSKHPVTKKLFNKFFYLFVTSGPIGLFWQLFRYENAPILGKRIWAGLVLLIGVVWLVFVFKYFFFNYFSEKREYDKQSLINKYIPGNKNSGRR